MTPARDARPGTGATARLFVAVFPPVDLRTRIADLGRWVASRSPRARWVPVDNLHLTVRFLGDVPAAEVDRVAQTLDDACRQLAPFELRLDRAGSFPADRPARVLWVGVEPSEPLAEATRRVRQRTEGWRPARARPRDHPHITAARCQPPWPRRDVERWKRSTPSALKLAFEVGALELVRSRLDRAGARYETAASLELTGPARRTEPTRAPSQTEGSR